VVTEVNISQHTLETQQKKPPFKKKHESSLEGEPLQEIRVLYVEDQDFFQKMMNAIGKKFHWALTVASTGQEGLACASEKEYDIILMDIVLGEKSEYNGYETARKIKEINPHHKIVSFSSSPIEERVEKGLEMDGHLEKNLSPKYLQEALLPYLLPLQFKEKKRKINPEKKKG